MNIALADRISSLPPYLFARIDELKAKAREKGVDIIDLGIGDPDLATPAPIVAALQRAAADPKHHPYPSYVGMESFRRAACEFMMRRFGVRLDAGHEALALIGSKEGIAHLPVALVNPGDLVLVPDPGYPVYATWTTFCGGEVYPVRLRRENDFLPDLDAIPKEIARRAKLFWVNYPNNPTAALASLDFYKRLVAFARTNNVILASDMAYSEIYYDCEPPPSLLQAPGALDCALEFHSLSKTFNMTGWRVAFAVGNPDLVAALAKVKTHTDSGTFEAIQVAATEALSSAPASVAGLRQIYKERVELLCDGLTRAGYEVLRPKATFYCLVVVPKGMTSLDFAARLLEQTGVVATPATGFGPGGEGFIRLTVCADKSRLAQAVERLTKVKL